MIGSPEAVSAAVSNRSDGTASLAIGTVKSGVAVGAGKAAVAGKAVTVAAGDATFATLTTFQRRRANMPAFKAAERVEIAPGASRVYAVCADATGALMILDTDGVPSYHSVATVPPVNDDLAFLGTVKVKNGSANPFKPGTTLLDAAGITATYSARQVIFEGEAA